jgi:hypothetical protein
MCIDVNLDSDLYLRLSPGSDSECGHPQVEVVELSPLENGTPVLQGRCLACGETDLEPLRIEYAPRPLQIGDRWYPMVTNRAGLAVCAACGRLIFPDLSPVPVILFVRDEDTGEVVGEVDFCERCGSAALRGAGVEAIPVCHNCHVQEGQSHARGCDYDGSGRDLAELLDRAALMAEDAKDDPSTAPALSQTLQIIVVEAARAGLLDDLIAALTDKLHVLEPDTDCIPPEEVRGMLPEGCKWERRSPQ